MFSIISKSPGEPILHAARRGAALWGEGIPGASILPCATQYFTAQRVVPHWDRETGRQHLRGQSHAGGHLTRHVWAAGGAKPARSPSARREGERAAPPCPPGPLSVGTDETLVKVHSVQTSYPKSSPTRARTHAQLSHRRRRRGCPPTELNRVRRQGEAEFRNLV